MSNFIEVGNQETSIMNPGVDQGSYCSFTAGTIEQKAMLFNGMNNPDIRLSDEINQVIEVTDIYAEFIEILDDETGELTTVPRVVLFDSKGKSHQAVSVGIYNAVKKMLRVFGEPATWDAPLKIKVKQQSIKERKMLTFEVIG